MDNQQLKKYLMEQKIPLDQAVEKKLAYLKSDDAFVEPFSDWKLSVPTVRKNQDDWDFVEAFNNVKSGAAPVSYNARQTTVQNQDSTEETTVRAPMTMAERIAALRGYTSVTQGISTCRKRQ